MSEIHYSVENGKHVFRKKIDSVEEALFYNKEYFSRIGYPDAEVSIETTGPDGVARGGAYSNPEKLTVPFRHFVFLVQSNKSSDVMSFLNKRNLANEEREEERQPVEKQNEPNEGFIERLGKYNTQAYDYMKTGVNRFSDYVKPSDVKPDAKPVNVEEQETIQDTKPVNVEEPVTKPDNVEEQETIQDTKPVNVEDANEPTKVEYWVVKIPFIERDNVEPKGKYEMEEVKLMQTILQKKVEKTLPLKEKGLVGYECIKMEDRVLLLYNEKAKECVVSGLEGSLMSKYVKVLTSGRMH